MAGGPMTIAVARRFAVGTLLAVALRGGCGDSARNEEDGGTPLAPRARSSSTARSEAPAPGPGLSAAPRWLREYCRSVAHRSGGDVLCPRLAPAGFAPTPNLEALPPSRSGYVIEANAETHWAFGAEVERSSVIDAYGPARTIGTTRVRGVAGTWRLVSQRGGIYSKHLVLEWRWGRFAYAVSVHSGDSRAGRRTLRAFAGAMVPAGRAR